MSMTRKAYTKATGNGQSSRTISFDCNGGTVLLVFCYATAANKVSGVTYNGDALSLWGMRGEGSDSNNGCSIWGLFVPDSGTHDIVISYTVSTAEDVAFVESWDGSATSGTVGADFAEGENNGTGNSMTCAITPKKTGSMLFGMFRTEDGTNSCGTNMSEIQEYGAYGCRIGNYSPTTADSEVTMNASHANGGAWAFVVVEVPLPVVVSFVPQVMMM